MIEQMLTPQVRLSILPEYKCKGNYLSLRFLLPLGEDTSSYALLPYVLSRGSLDYPDIDAVDRAADLLYGAEITPMVSSEGEWQVVGFSASFLSDRMAPDGCPILEGVLDIISSLLLRPLTVKGAFRSDYVESERSKLLDKLRALKDSPDVYAIKRLEELMCEGEPYAIYERGNEEAVAAVTPAGLWEAYQSLLRSAPLTVLYSGDCPTDRLTELVTERFGCLKQTPAPLPPHTVLRSAQAPLRTFEETMPVGQSQLVLGLRSGSVVNDRDHDAFSLFFAMLSSAPTARLFTRVRERRSLCYTCSALTDFHKGILLISCGLRKERMEEAYAAITEQLSDLAEGRFSDDELESARRWLAGRYPIVEDSPISLANWYFHRSPTGIADSPASLAERMMKVGRADVMNAARKLSPNALYTLIGQIEEDCEEAECDED